MKRDGACISLWQETTPDFKTATTIANPDKIYDVIIAGGGITGITAGLLLQKAGKSVLIAEAQTPGFGTTGGTTAHLNTCMDTSYYTIQKNFGKSDAQLIAQGIEQALSLINKNVQEYTIDCGYHELSAYLLSQNAQQSKELKDIFTSSLECGVEASWTDHIPAPLPFEKVLCFPGQATFHPTRYLAALVKAFIEAGGILMEHCRVTDLKEEDTIHTVTSTSGNFKTYNFIYATHIPPGVNLLHFRCAPYRSYAMSMKLKNEQDYPPALLYDMYDPYHYYRTQEIDGELFLIAGGEDHKTGHEENTEACFRKLEAHVRNYFNVDTITHRWSSQYFEPNDGLPYIGHLPGHSENVYVATGYGGNGMIYGNLAALLLTAKIITGTSEYEELLDPNRIKPVAGFTNFIKEAADVVGNLIGKIVPPEQLVELADLAPGEARIVRYEGKKLAIYKDEKDNVYALNSACTHIKCDVSWNNAEKTWDCPCHGSRFSYTGEMLTAPARKDLEQISLW